MFASRSSNGKNSHFLIIPSSTASDSVRQRVHSVVVDQHCTVQQKLARNGALRKPFFELSRAAILQSSQRTDRVHGGEAEHSLRRLRDSEVNTFIDSEGVTALANRHNRSATDRIPTTTPSITTSSPSWDFSFVDLGLIGEHTSDWLTLKSCTRCRTKIIWLCFRGVHSYADHPKHS